MKAALCFCSLLSLRCYPFSVTELSQRTGRLRESKPVSINLKQTLRSFEIFQCCFPADSTSIMESTGTQSHVINPHTMFKYAQR